MTVLPATNTVSTNDIVRPRRGGMGGMEGLPTPPWMAGGTRRRPTDEEREKYAASLTPEQKEQYDKFQAEMRRRMAEAGAGGGGGGGGGGQGGPGGLDAAVAARMAASKAHGKLPRYLARITPGAEGPQVTVGPVEVDAASPAASLRGTEAFVAFHTERYRQYPMVVRGAGAGGEVTAAGVLADILRLAQNLRGRR